MDKDLDPDGLEQRKRDLQARLQHLHSEGLREVALQVARAEVESELWSVKQLLAEMMGDHKTALDCSKEAKAWEEQKTRAVKYSIGDRLTAAEELAEQRSGKRGRLKHLSVVEAG